MDKGYEGEAELNNPSYVEYMESIGFTRTEVLSKIRMTDSMRENMRAAAEHSRSANTPPDRVLLVGGFHKPIDPKYRSITCCD